STVYAPVRIYPCDISCNRSKVVAQITRYNDLAIWLKKNILDITIRARWRIKACIERAIDMKARKASGQLPVIISEIASKNNSTIGLYRNGPNCLIRASS